MLTSKDFRQLAKASLGDRIFGGIWFKAALASLIFTLICMFFDRIHDYGFVVLAVISGAMTAGIDSIFLYLVRGVDRVDIGDLFRHFNGTTIATGLLIYLFTTLWGLLLVVPGIVKTYAYSMAYYVHMDNPEFTARECIAESQRLMQGNKWRLFCLDISFIGWFIVGLLCFGIGTVWVSAWNKAAYAEFYQDLITNDSGKAAAQQTAE